MPRLFERKLNALSVKRLTKPGRHADGSGLYLNVEKSGSKSWLLRVTVKGKARTIGLGSLRDVTLAEAREKSGRLRKAAKEGRDPLAERDGDDRGTSVPTFEAAAQKVFDEHNMAWKSGRHRMQWINSLRDHVFPTIGDMRVDDIGSSDVLNVLTPIWLSKPTTALRVKQRMKAIFDWCLAKHFRETMNPVDSVRMALPKQPPKRKHHAALPYEELPVFLEKLQASNSLELVKIGLFLLIHTASRTGEILGARWDEMNLDDAIWTIPAEWMKAGLEHRVPLTVGSKELLNDAKMFKTNSPYIFPSRSGKKPLCSNVLIMALGRIDRNDITVHGFRSSFRNWAAECTSTQNDVCEAALAHQVKDKVEAAYNRTDHFEKRRLLMNEWSRFLKCDRSSLIKLRAQC